MTTATAAASQAFDSTPMAVRDARVFARNALSDADVPGLLDDVEVCVSELATNAVRHAVPNSRRFLIKVSADASHVRVEVHDSKRRRPRMRHPDAEEERGRGLLLVNALATRWGVVSRPFSKYVWFELNRGNSC